MFFSFKTYQLFRQPTKSSSGKKHDRSWIIKSPNAKIVTLDMQGDAGEDEDVSQDLQEEQSRYNSNAPIYKKVLMTTFGRLRSLISCIFAIGQPQPSKSRKVWQLKVWHPSPGTTTLFTWYSPLSLMAIHNIGGKDYPYWIALSICCSLMLSFTIERFQDLVRDREILAGQVLKEYSQEIYSIENFPPESQVVLITDRRQSQAQAYRRPAPAESQAAIQARLYAQRMEKASVGAKVGRRDGGEYSDEEESG
ncbi:hypothetical protein DFS34DRAFT_199929 [Phlyctochytrium arcticum]|nr:hypothetical protein DFS34DRAFT_199929 [Phlyctochytrium arcticum]